MSAEDGPIPYMARTRAYYQALGYEEPYRWAHFADVPFTPLRKPLKECRIGLVTTAALYDPAHGDQGPGRGLQRRGQVPPRLCACDRGRSRRAHLPRHLRPHPHHRGGSQQLVPARAAEARRRRRPHRRHRTALLRRADHAQPAQHAGAGRARHPRPHARGQGRCRGAGAELPGLPPDHQPRRAPSRGRRHPDRDHGLRQGHRGTCRRPALPVQRLPARQRRRQAARCRHRRPRRSISRSICWRAHRRRARPCNRRSAGRTIPAGSATSTISKR